MLMSRLRAASAVAAAAALALPVSFLAAPADTVIRSPGGDAGIGDNYFPLDGNGGINVRKYRIRDRYAFDTRRLSGSTVLTVRATDDLTVFNLDFLLPVTSVTVDGRPASYSKPRQHEVRIWPRTPIADGERFTVRLTYAGFPGRRSYDGESNWLANRREVVAMNQPHMAPWWFPSNDHPADKARMDITITVPRGHRVFANGRPVARRVHGDQVTRRWVADQPMATYLAMFAAGKFQVDSGVRDGLPWRAVVSKQIPPVRRQANLDLMRRTPGVVAGLEEDLGRYPFSTVGGLVTALDVGFALENQTLPTYPETGRGYLLLVVHELAHQWFGDSVALHRWRDIWLNEGAATFMERRWVENHGGQTAADWLRDKYDLRPPGFWDLAIGDPGAGNIFAGPVYTRGAMTFQALRNVIGDDDFWTVLQRWVTDNRHGHGTRAEFEALAEEVSGDDLDAFFNAWLMAGKPADTTDNGLG